MFRNTLDNPFLIPVRLRAVASRALAQTPQPPRVVTWLDMVDVFGPSVVLVSIGYRAFLIGGFALWRPALLLPVAVILVATFLFRMFHVGRATWAVRRILTWCVGGDGTVVSVPRRGKIIVSVGGGLFSAIEISRNPNRPKVGDRVGVGILRNAGSEVIYLG